MLEKTYIKRVKTNMDMKCLLKRFLILDTKRYENKNLDSYKKLNENFNHIDLSDLSMSHFIESITNEINKMNFKLYLVNFNSDYFDAMYFHCMVILMITLPFSIWLHMFLTLIILIVYIAICMISNLLLTVYEICDLRRELVDIYNQIQMKL